MGNAAAARRAAQPPFSGQALRVLKDEKLAAMVAAGSDDAFAVLYRRHHQAIYRYCLSLLGQEADARDALQSSMLAALSALRARPIEGEFEPWLFRIAHNQSISTIRGRTRETPDADPSPAASSDDPETREELRMLVADLGALPERQRGAIVMRELSGLSFAAIGAALGTSEAGGKQLVYEARSALHDLRAGHEMSCELVRERISADDRRLLRGRKVRSHLRGCQPCQDFEHAIRRRRTALAAFAPPLAPLAAAAILGDVFGGGGGAGGAGGGGGAVGAGGIASGGTPLAGTVGLKAAAAALLAGATGVGAYAAGTALFSGDAASPPVAEAEAAPPQADRHASRSPDPARKGSGGKADAGAGAGVAAKRAAGPDADPETSPTVGSPPPSDLPSDPSVSATSGGDSGGDATTEPPPSPATPSTPDTPPQPPTQPPTDPPPPGGGSGVPPGTPPGHGGTIPGHGGIPPGQAGSEVPPGHLGRP
jgi:RNA polymerase sigma factor (sigma-70 family)